MITAGVPLKAKRANIWIRDEHDFYIEPEWTVDRLFSGTRIDGEVWDPACGSGTIVTVARKHGHVAFGTDLVDRGFRGVEVYDFLRREHHNVDNIVCNPPFKHGVEFVKRGLEYVSKRAIFLLPISWLHGDTRSRWFETTPLAEVLILAPRPSMPPGEMILAGHKPEGGRIDFAWYVFDHNHDGPPAVRWLRRDAEPKRRRKS